MKFYRVLVTAACTAAFAVPGVVTAQQDTTRMRMKQDSIRQDSVRRATAPRATSEQRLRVQKGQADGRLDMRADSIAAAERARQDSLNIANMAMQRQRDSLASIERMRTDSIARMERMQQDSLNAIAAMRRDSLTRMDSIAREEALRRQERERYLFGGNGWYLGIGGGVSLPINEFEDVGYNSGFNVTVPIGWHRPGNFLGIRLDLGYDRFSGEEFIGQDGDGDVRLANPNPQVFSATLNLTARIPVSPSRRVGLYAVGGAGLYHFRSFGGRSALSGFLGNDVLSTDESSIKETRNKLGAQIGAGIDWKVGTASIFIESRFVNVFADRDDTVQFRDFFGANRSSTLQWVPIIIGFTLR